MYETRHTKIKHNKYIEHYQNQKNFCVSGIVTDKNEKITYKMEEIICNSYI
jgi:hypothetical protein